MVRHDRNSPGVRLFRGVLAALLTPCVVLADQEPAVLKGVEYLKAHYAGKTQGESAMIALALLKAELPPSDGAVQACLARVRGGFSSSAYTPNLADGRAPYEITAAIMALSAQDAVANKSLIGVLANLIISQQKPNGSWDYTHRTHGDTSISQYAVLGLWEAQNAGISIPQSVWDSAARWFMSVQDYAGGWNYHRDETNGMGDTVAMTAAGVGSLLICQRQLDPQRRNGGAKGASSLLTPLGGETAGDDATEREPAPRSVSLREIKESLAKGMSWIGANFAPGSAISGQSTNYMLYGVERIGALADRQSIGRIDWFEKGRAYLRSTQSANGSWNNGQHGVEMNTVWAILFLTKSTAKSLRKLESRGIGAGTLLGGRGLPKDLSSMTVAGGRVVSRPMNGAIEGMLAALEDPRGDQADAAVAGLAERYQREGPAVLRPHKPRFKKMLADADPSVRNVAVWCLARTGDLDVVPSLIDALMDTDDGVVTSARLGLQLTSRKIDGLGPDIPSTPEDRRAAAQRWHAWYQAIRPLDFDAEDEDLTGFKRAGSPPAHDSRAGSAPR